MAVSRDDLVAFGWGAAEAVLWFVVPDVFLTSVALRSGLKRSLRLVVLAIVGAVLGGIITYAWGATAPDSAAQAMAAMPGVDTAMVERVRDEVAASGPAALMAGPERTQPYKLYAAAAGQQGESLLNLALWTVPGRAGRLLAATVAAWAAAAVGGRWMSPRAIRTAWALVWIGLYVVLWS